MTCLGIIPARGGSKGVYQKNIREVAGKPLIAWTIECALKANSIDTLIVSTDSEEIAEVARHYGANVPFMRPAELAEDSTPDFPVFAHAVQWLAENNSYAPDIVVWLRPTTPLRIPVDIDNSVKELMNQADAECIRSVCEAEHHPYWMKNMIQDTLTPFCEGKDEKKYYQRQQLPPAYRLNGAVDAVKTAYALQSHTLFPGKMIGYVMPLERSVDIDNEIDIILADILLNRRQT